PARYLTPDVAADCTSVALSAVDGRTMGVSDASGITATPTYKVSIAYRDGYTASGTLTIAGPDAVAKAQLAGDALLRRTGHAFDHSNIECLGAGACAPGVKSSDFAARLAAEVVLRVSVRDRDKAKVERFAKEFAP